MWVSMPEPSTSTFTIISFDLWLLEASSSLSGLKRRTKVTDQPTKSLSRPTFEYLVDRFGVKDSAQGRKLDKYVHRQFSETASKVKSASSKFFDQGGALKIGPLHTFVGFCDFMHVSTSVDLQSTPL